MVVLARWSCAVAHPATIRLMTMVLLAEDDPTISEPLARALRREGYEVTVVQDGPAALEASRLMPDLLVLDLGLPGMDGLDVCRRVRAEGLTVPVAHPHGAGRRGRHRGRARCGR